ncbi:MAG: AAA-like domain-containing protein [Rhizonema sp. PD37]|nr:AAA-like domain-containing protein [Rhizonema sp. PD37]
MMRILFLTADPTDTVRLRLQEELRDIKERLRQANLRERFQLEYRFSLRPGDISQAILDFEPHLVHFSGHGTSTGELCLEDESGTMQPVKPKALAALFELVANQVNCVVLNACYSDIQAKAIVKHIPFVIGMKQVLGDQAAIAFAVSFYKALGADRSIEEAYKFARAEIHLQGIPEELTPVLRKKEDKAPVDNYVDHSDIEKHCYNQIKLPGSLLRIKAPDNMGKTSLMNRIVGYARDKYKYQIVTLNCYGLVDDTVATDLERFLKSFCIAVGNKLRLSNQLDEYWNNSATCIYKTGDYFERYLLTNIDSPLVLAIDDVDLIFEQPKIANDFCSLIRNWHNLAKGSDQDSKIWQKLRLIIVHSTEYYAELDINRSPLANVGKVVDLPELTSEQVQRLVKRLGMKWTNEDVEQVMGMVGGHPFLVKTACDYIKRSQKTLEELLQDAPMVAGPFSDHLGESLEIIKKNPQLKTAFNQIVWAEDDNPVQLEDPKIAKWLQRLGLAKLQGNFAKPRCQLYRQYFRKYLN